MTAAPEFRILSVVQRLKGGRNIETAVNAYYAANSLETQGGTLDITAFGGLLGIRWDEDAKVTWWGGLSYFATFLKASQMFDRLVEDAPFVYTSPNAPKVRDVVGTMALAILAGYSRYCHIERIRNDTACAELLGMTKVMFDESVRRALKNCDEAKLDAWLARHEREMTEPLLQFAYVLDADNTVKTVYGHQEGAELGYNTHKPRRPSYNYHPFSSGRRDERRHAKAWLSAAFAVLAARQNAVETTGRRASKCRKASRFPTPITHPSFYIFCQFFSSCPYIIVPLGGYPAERARAGLRTRFPQDFPVRGPDFLV